SLKKHLNKPESEDMLNTWVGLNSLITTSRPFWSSILLGWLMKNGLIVSFLWITLSWWARTFGGSINGLLFVLTRGTSVIFELFGPFSRCLLGCSLSSSTLLIAVLSS